MARIVNQIVTQSKAEGFQETGRQIEELSKKQTRLGNESTNTGRQFASQASGLGGLVAAYAAAAATTFALQQSFSALNAAARSQAMVEGVKSLAASMGQDGSKIISSLQGITRGQLSMTESAQNAAIALSAGLKGDQIEQLADIATKASKVLGRDLTDSMQRLTRGVGKLEPELLDELGIFTRIEPAVERYAARLGRAASSLTNFERRQAFANAVAEEGSTKYRNVDTSISDSAQNLNRLAANLADVATKIGQTIVTIFDPLISFLNKDLSNIAGLVLLLGTLIFSKLGQVTAGGIQSLNRSFDAFASKTTARFTDSTKSAEKFRDAIVSLRREADKVSLGGLAGPKAQQAETRAAVRQIKQGEISVTDLPRLQKAIQTQVATERKLGTDAAKVRAEALEGLISPIGTAAAAATPGVTLLGKAFNGVSSAISLAGRALSFMVNLIGRLFLVYTVLDLIGTAFSYITGKGNIFTDALVSVGNSIVKLFEGYRNSRTASDAFLSSFTEGDEAVKKSTSSLTIYNKALDTTKEKMNSIVDKQGEDVKDLGLAQLRVDQARSDVQRLGRDTEIRRERGGQPITAAQNLANAEAELQKLLAEQAGKDRLAIEKEFQTQINKIREQARTTQDKNEQETLYTTATILSNRKVEYLKFYDEVSQAIGHFGRKERDVVNGLTTLLSKNLGITANQTVDLFRARVTSFGEEGKIVFQSLDGSIKAPAISIKELTDNGLDPLRGAMATTGTTIRQLTDNMLSSSVESSTLQGYLSTLENSYNNLNKAINAIDPDNPLFYTMNRQAAEMKNLIDRTKEVIGGLKTLEQSEKDLKDVFGSSIQRAGKLLATGEVGSGGNIAFTSESQKTNQLKFLDSMRIQGLKINELEAERESLQQRQNKLSIFELVKRNQIARELAQINKELEIATNQQKAFLSESIDFMKTTDQIYKLEKQKTNEKIHQYSMTLADNRIAQMQRDEEKAQLTYRLNAEQKSIDNQIKIARMEAGLKRLENAKLYLELSVQDNERTAQRLQLEEQLRDVRAESAKLAVSRSYLQGNLALERDLALMQEFAGLGGPQGREQKQYELQIRQKEEQIAQTAIDMNLAAEKNLKAAELDKINASIKLQIANNEKALVDKRAEIEQERIKQDFAVRYAEMDERARQLGVAKNIATVQAQKDKTQIQFDKETQLLELSLTEERYKQLELQSRIFDKHIRELAAIFGRESGGRAADLAGFTLEMAATTPDIARKRENFIRDFENAYKRDLGIAAERAQISIPGMLGTQKAAIEETARERTNEADKKAKDAITLADQEIKAIEDRRTATQKLERQQAALVELERRAGELRANDAVKAATAEQAAAELRYTIRQTELSNEVERLRQTQDRQKAELALLKELARLKGDNLFVALSESIDIFRTKTTDFITTMLTDVINGTKKAKDVFRDFMFSLAVEIQKTIIKKTISEPIAEGVAGIFGGALKGAATGAGISAYIPGTSAYTSRLQGEAIKLDQYATPAIGGPVKQMATGGRAGLRDNVPAFLQPGEFVIRRPAAQELGDQILKGMNAHGSIPLSAALEVIRKQGNRGDTELAHVNRREKALLKALGGSGTINRKTGLRQFNGYEGGGTSMSDTSSSDYGGYDGGFGSVFDFGPPTPTVFGGFTPTSTIDRSIEASLDRAAATMAMEQAVESKGIEGLSQSQDSKGFFDNFMEISGQRSTLSNLSQAVKDAQAGDLGKALSGLAERGLATTAQYGGLTAMVSTAIGGPLGILGGLAVGALLDAIEAAARSFGATYDYSSGAEGRAIGGYVKRMAGGGFASLRDRVPALLEPGEFVVRRPAAMAIGGQVLNNMNATGQVNPGNVMVNVVNQGTPQTVQGTPRISRQGENMVIDIVIKDIQNNGPIRQTLKGMR